MGETPCLRPALPLTGIILKRSLGPSKISTTVGSSTTVSLVETGVGGWGHFFEPYQILTETL